MKKIVLSGYYGFNNAGDEAVLYAIIQALRSSEPELEITVLSGDPQNTARRYAVQAVSRRQILKIIRALKPCDLLISGGGSLLQDVSSANSPLYYLGIIWLAQLLGKPVMVYAQGIGPLRRALNRKLTAWLFNRAEAITVRDEGSKDELRDMGVSNDIVVTADPVLGIAADIIEREAGCEILRRNGISVEAGRLAGVFIRAWRDNQFLPELAAVCDQLAAEGWTPAFIPMQFPQDIAVARQAVGLMKNPAVVLKELYTPPEMLALTKSMDVVIGMRLHALINSMVAGVPYVGLSYDPKVERFLEQTGQQSLNPVEALDARVLLESVRWAAAKKESFWAESAPKRDVLAECARQSAAIALTVLAEAGQKNRRT